MTSVAIKPVVVGCRTTHFTDEQLAVFKEHQPLGMIIFAEPFKAGPDTVHHVVQQFRSVCPHAKIFTDAEGGRVNRMKPEFGFGWRDVPGARQFADLALHDLPKACRAIYLNAQVIGHDLMQFGIDVDCAPVVDLVGAEVITNTGQDEKPHATSASLYNRSYGDDPMIVSACAKAFADGLHSMGVTSVLKHAPGYGRVAVDPHYGLDKIRATLPEMLASDLIPYREMRDYPAIMTAHTVYENIDPLPATRSKRMMQIMRQEIGFNGVIVADTIEMNSIYPEGFSTTERDQFGMGLPLPGTLAFVTRETLAAGCDVVLHSDCSRDFSHTVEILEAAPTLDADKTAWLLKTLNVEKSNEAFDREGALAELDALLSN